MFNVGDVGQYQFDGGNTACIVGTIIKITSKFLFVRLDKTYGGGGGGDEDVVVFNADGTGTSRSPKDNTLGNGDPYPAGADDGTDQGSTFVVTKPAKNVQFLEADKELAKVLRGAVKQASELREELERRGYIVEGDIYGGEVSIEKTVVL